MGNIAGQMNVAKRLENTDNQMAIAAARQSAIYNNSILSQMGDLFPISKIAYGKFGLVEVKASGKKPRVLQEHRHDQLRSLGYKVFVLDDAGQIGGILDGIQTT